ncbi:hypothetical protein J7337_008073 [Fusarium musae]|uniref:NmrA-like domain-containing protein n=1 Tax=Fusarium musae TaxID=1042133 RepID=A0A9P8DCU2_9HYPO|nr:hypothetical protein J7337_008073 [Fusarium musae]KAG9499615.1 hypothetical protein J7337_008073 [Fusarium musae]
MSQIIAFVTGATGHQGGAATRKLLSTGVKVHALVRDPSSKTAIELQHLGAQLFPGNFDDVSSLKTAVKGATAVFLNVMPVFPDTNLEVVHAKSIISAAIGSGTVTSIAYSSLTMTGKHGNFPNWGPDYPMAWYWLNKAQIESMVRESDLGVESLTPAQIVQELSRVSGVEIGLEFYDEEEAKDLAVRNPKIYAELWANEVGYQVDFEELEKYGIRPTKFSEYLEKHRDQVIQTFA